MTAATLLLSAGLGAAPTVFTAPELGFELDLATPGAAICFAQPRAMRTDPTACEGLDVEGVVAKIPPGTRLAAIVRLDGWAYLVHAQIRPTARSGPMTKEEGRALHLGATGKTPGFKAAQPEPDFLVLNGVQVLHFPVVPEAASPATTFENYFVVGSGETILVAFSTDVAHRAELEKAAASTMKTVKLPAWQASSGWRESDEVSRWQELSEAAKGVGMLAAICVAAIWAYRSLRRRPKSGPPS